METRTHDTIFGDFGDNWISAGWENDLIFGGDHVSSQSRREDADTMYGGAGNDILIALSTGQAYGQEGREPLIGHRIIGLGGRWHE